MEDVGICYGHFVFFQAFDICILWPFGSGTLVYFSPFWYIVPGAIWQPCLL
jgi:hypothetical protein